MSSVNTILTMKGFRFIAKQSYLTDPGKFNYFLSSVGSSVGCKNPKVQISNNTFSIDLYTSMCLVDKNVILGLSVMNEIDTLTFYAHTMNKLVDNEHLEKLIEEYNPDEYSISVVIDNEYMDIRKYVRKTNDSIPDYKETKIFSNVDLIDKAKEFVSGEVDKEGNLIVSVDFGKDKPGTMVIGEKDSEGNIEIVDTVDLPNMHWTKQRLLEYAEKHHVEINKSWNKSKIIELLLEGE